MESGEDVSLKLLCCVSSISDPLFWCLMFPHCCGRAILICPLTSLCCGSFVYDPLLWCSMFPHGFDNAMLCCLLTSLCCGSFMHDPLLWCSMFPHGYDHAMLCCLLTPLCCGSFMYDPLFWCLVFAHGCDHAMSTMDIVSFWLFRYGSMPLLTTYANMSAPIVTCSVLRYTLALLHFLTVARVSFPASLSLSQSRLNPRRLL